MGYHRHMRLRDRYAELTKEQREALAAKAGIKAPYLWQIATGWSKSRPPRRPSIDVMVKLAAADPKLTLKDMAQEFSEQKAAA